jgi:nitrite reductase (NADH) large subunit
VTTRDGHTAHYDRLLIATGSNPFVIPVPGHDLPGVMGYRDIADVETMLDAAARYGRPRWSSAAACSASRRPMA